MCSRIYEWTNIISTLLEIRGLQISLLSSNYQRLLQVSRLLFRADRTWPSMIGLQATPDCPLIFNSAGYYNFLKCSQLCVQEIRQLQNTPVYKLHL